MHITAITLGSLTTKVIPEPNEVALGG